MDGVAPSEGSARQKIYFVIKREISWERNTFLNFT